MEMLAVRLSLTDLSSYCTYTMRVLKTWKIQSRHDVPKDTAWIIVY